MEIKCLECGNSVAQTPGRRKKEYCGSTCRSLHWKKKQQAGKSKRSPGRPKKEVVNGVDIQSKIAEVKAKLPQRPALRGNTESSPEEYMGHKIPAGLKGIDLSIWKAEIKENYTK